MTLASKLFKTLFIVSIALIAVGLGLPFIKQQLSIQGNSIDLKVRIPFTSQVLEVSQLPVDAVTQQDAQAVGFGLFAVLVLWKFISINPLHLLTDFRKKKEIHKELRKMDTTLEQIKQLGRGFD